MNVFSVGRAAPAHIGLGKAVRLSLLLAIALGNPGSAQTRRLSIDDLYDPVRRIDFSGQAPSDLSWISDSQYVWPKPRPGGGVEWLKVTAATGATEPLFDFQKFRAAFEALPGLREEDVRALPNDSELEMNAARNAAVIAIGNDLYHYAFGASGASRLTSDPYAEEEYSISPDGRQVAFVRQNNLFVVDLERRQEKQLTTSGTTQILNGKLDWVYQEEIYGRGDFRAYWWSPDSSHIAFLQVDDRPVPEFTVVDHVPPRLNVEQWDYPKAGDPNPIVKLGILPVVGGHVQWVDLAKYSAIDFLIVNVGWTPDSQRVVYQVQNREQFWLDVNSVAASGQNPQTLFRETTKAWVDVNGPVRWLADGSFLWVSDRSGWKHLYRYKADGSFIGAVTQGAWDIRTVHGVDADTGWVYFSAAERSHIGIDVYRVKLDARGLERLSEHRGTHRARFSPGFTHYIDTWSDLQTPPQVRLHEADGDEVRAIHESKIPQLAEFRFSKPELLQVKTRDGFVMEAMLIKPVDFDPSRKYPVVQFTYGGPGAASVADEWDAETVMWFQLLAQRGFAIWVCDNRLASGKGAQSQWPSYKNVGELELRDVEDGLGYLKQQPWVDPSRIGVSGWSFGGFMVTYALTHSTSFAMGIAGGSVTDWSLYDSIYTERFMLMPQNNPDGYARNSPLAAAKNLHGEILLIHGVMDENVHAQNTMKFSYALQKAGKPFRQMLYEKSRHGLTDPDLVKHMHQMMLDFMVETLRPTATH